MSRLTPTSGSSSIPPGTAWSAKPRSIRTRRSMSSCSRECTMSHKERGRGGGGSISFRREGKKGHRCVPDYPTTRARGNTATYHRPSLEFL